MSKKYELTVLLHPDLEANQENALAKVKGIVEKAGGKIIKEDNWGKKRLAYTIDKQDFAIYVFMEVELPPQAPLEISNALNITDEVLRYLLVAEDPKQVKAAQEKEEAKQAVA